MNKQSTKYIFTETDIKTFIDESVVSLPFTDFVTLIIDTNAQLLKTSPLRSHSVLISKYTKDDTLIYSDRLELPQKGNTSFDNILEPFSKNKPPKTEQKPKLKSVTANKILLILPLILSIVSIAISIQSKTKEVTNSKLENKVAVLEKTVANQKKQLDNQGEIDVFVRYFLPYLFSENQNSLKDFVSDKALSDIKEQKGDLISVIQEEIKPTEKGFRAVYVLSIKKDNTNKIKRIELEIEKNNSKKFNFNVTNIPKIKEVK